jgi:serine/threonine protein kinase
MGSALQSWYQTGIRGLDGQLGKSSRLMDLKVGSSWALQQRIGAGAFGEIYSGEHIITKEEVAIKLEPWQARPPQLFNESRIYKMLAGGVGIPQVRWYGVEGDYTVLVMDLLGRSLEDLFEMCQRRFSLKTVLMIADQLLARLQYLHEKGVIHRDIKPDNFVIGSDQQSNIIYVIDFGLARRYRDPHTNQHIPFREGKSLVGTARYTSINTHIGIEQSRRDDLEGLAYVLIYLLKGSLPWMGLKAENKQIKQEMISEKKLVTSVPTLCDGLPAEFAIFLDEVRKLKFTDRPNYELLRTMFRDRFLREGFVYDYQYDWLLTALPEVRPIVLRKFTVHEGKQAPSLPTPIIVKPKRNNPSAPILPTVLQKVPMKRPQATRGDRAGRPPGLPTLKALPRPSRV